MEKFAKFWERTGKLHLLGKFWRLFTGGKMLLGIVNIVVILTIQRKKLLAIFNGIEIPLWNLPPTEKKP